MIHFEREEAELSAAVGLSSDAILTGLDPSSAQQVASVRSRFEAFVASQDATLSTVQRLERDRLDSLMRHLYGPSGLLSRAGALLSLRDRLHRISALAPRCLSSDGAGDRLRREALLARTFARERLARGAETAGERIAESVQRAAEAVTTLDRFATELQVYGAERGTAVRALGAYTVSDIADLANEPTTLSEGIAFVLRRLADVGYIRVASNGLQQLCAQHAASIRDLLWEAAEAGYSRRETPATWLELTELDQVLEALRSKLTDAAVDAAERCAGIAQLYALVAASRAADAANLVEQALAPLRETVIVGIAAEVR